MRLTQDDLITMKVEPKAVPTLHQLIQDLNPSSTECGLKLLWNGLPPLIFSGGSSSSASIPGDHGDAKCTTLNSFMTDIGALSDPFLNDISIIWKTAFRSNQEKLHWGSESDVQGFVKLVIQDCLVLAGLEKKVSCFNELGIHSVRPDIWIVVTSCGVPIGVVEVKKPTTSNHQDALENSKVHGQIFDYMKRLQTFTGIENVFGIITSYEKWVFCSLKKRSFQQRANVELEPLPLGVIDYPTTPILFSFAQNSKKEIRLDSCASPKIQDFQRKIYCTPAIEFNSDQLIPLLTHLILKMYYSPRNPVNLVDANRCYIELSPKGWSWRRISFETLNFLDFPTAGASRFLLLYDFRGGADGRVWLACSTTGRVCVIKFYNGNWKQADIERECSIWNRVWNLPARTLHLCSKLALIMPFVVSLTEDQVKGSECYLDAVLLAIKTLSREQYYHGDLKWKHVGFFLKESTKYNDQEVVAIFFDLIRVKRVDVGPLELERMMLEKLGLQDGNISSIPLEILLSSPYKPSKK